MATPRASDSKAAPPGAKADAAREKRLGEALRANLKRRKAQAAERVPLARADPAKKA